MANGDSIVSICNSGLYLIGGQAITAITDDSDRARLCNQFYDKVRRATLRGHPWNFASDRSTLAVLAATPTWGWDYQYTLPTDCLRVIKMEEQEDGEKFKIEGRKLLTDSTSANILYIFDEDDPVQFDPLFSEALAARLASNLAYPVAGSLSLGNAMFQLYLSKIQEARTIDGMEGDLDSYESNELIDVR